jgi:murein DD-endopeptidase MepM/ murein hydrolase activator NlpD
MSEQFTIAKIKFDRIYPEFINNYDFPFSLPFPNINDVQIKEIVGFGLSTHPINKNIYFHKGVDFPIIDFYN